MSLRSLLVTAALLGGALEAQQQTPAKAKIQADMSDTVVGPWVYDDIEQGYALAKKANKPMLVVFR
jgi:hypothetical protein